ncbi:MAG: recombinase family protein [Rhizomicrobium sp.]
MKTVYAYVRVSTQKQGVQGSSLQEQREAIARFAANNGLTIAEWFEERETAAKGGRPKFREMLQGLVAGTASGVIIHKIDRSARNLRDWADLGDLIDRGVEVHFAHESLDLHSRGGRLSADIQAVVAADFIRNLRQEVVKGINGRLKQGLYPFEAPIGYRNMGKGKPKEIDPIQGPLVKQAFELYASGEYNFDQLRSEMHRRGLRGRGGCTVSMNTFTGILNNPFYIGLIHIKRSGQNFQGVHQPLISKALFDRTQAVLRGNRPLASGYKNDFRFRRMIRCGGCGAHLIGERHKGRYVYYRCHKPGCGPVCLSEQAVEDAFTDILGQLRLEPGDVQDVRDIVDDIRGIDVEASKERASALDLQIAKCEDRLSRLTDVLIDGAIDKDAYETKKAELLCERRGLLDERDNVGREPSFSDIILKNLELAETAYLRYRNGIDAEKRDMVLEVTSNLEGRTNKPAITLKSPFQEIVNWRVSKTGAPCRDESRTRSRKLLAILAGTSNEEISTFMRKKIPKIRRSPRRATEPTTQEPNTTSLTS